MNKRDREIVLKFKNALSDEVLACLDKLIVYGSRARGDGQEDSDLDVIALVKEKNHELEKQMDDTAYDVMWEHDFSPIISLKIITESRFRDALARGFSFYRHIQSDGIAV